jgi:hypothetical protein
VKLRKSFCFRFNETKLYPAFAAKCPLNSCDGNKVDHLSCGIKSAPANYHILLVMNLVDLNTYKIVVTKYVA